MREAKLSPLSLLPVGRLPGAASVLTAAVPDIHHAREFVPGAKPWLSARNEEKRWDLESKLTGHKFTHNSLDRGNEVELNV